MATALKQTTQHRRPVFSSVRQIRELREVADCSVTIVTGDSVLTACHVAREVGLIDEMDDAGEALSSRGKGKSKGSVGKSKKTSTTRASKSMIKAITKSALTSEASGKGRKTALLLTATEQEVSVLYGMLSVRRTVYVIDIFTPNQKYGQLIYVAIPTLFLPTTAVIFVKVVLF